MFNTKTAAGVAAAAALLLALAGCSAGGAGNDSAQERSFSAENSTASDGTPEPSVTPSPSETPWPFTEAENGRTIYLGAVKAPDSINGIELPSDDELIEDGRKACEQLAAGVPFNSVDVIPDNPNPPMVDGKRTQITNSRSLAGLASETLCTEFNQRNVAP